MLDLRFSYTHSVICVLSRDELWKPEVEAWCVRLFPVLLLSTPFWLLIKVNRCDTKVRLDVPSAFHCSGLCLRYTSSIHNWRWCSRRSNVWSPLERIRSKSWGGRTMLKVVGMSAGGVEDHLAKLPFIFRLPETAISEFHRRLGVDGCSPWCVTAFKLKPIHDFTKFYQEW